MSSTASNSTSLGGTPSSKAKVNALRAIDALLSEATNTTKTPTRRMQPLPPNRRDTLARSPYVPSSHPGYYDNNDNNNSDDKENDESESDDASLNAFSSSKEFAVLLQSHVQKQQLLHRQRLQRQHEKQQRLRDYTEYQQNIAQKQHWKREDEREDDSDQEQNEYYERELGEIDPQAHDMRVRASDLPNPFLGPTQDPISPFVTRQRRSLKAKSQNSTTAAASTSTSTTPATPTTSTIAGSLTQTPGTTTTTTGSTTSGVTPKRQYKKTILRQQAALLAAQIKDENEIRDLEATRRVFARTNVIEHLRSLRSRLAYAHYKVDQGLEEQPLHIVAELFEESLGESGDSDDNHGTSSSRGTGLTAPAPADMPTRQLMTKERGNTVSLEDSLVSYATHISSAEPGDDEQNLASEELNHSQSLDDERPLSSIWKTPTKNSYGRQIHVYSDEDSGSDNATDSDLGVYTPTLQPLSHVDLPISITRDELLLQQQLQLEELQRKQLEQLQELQRMQREQQIALQKAHAQLPERHRSTLNNEMVASTPRSRGNVRLVRETSNNDKENSEPSAGGIRSEKGRRHTNVSVPFQQSQPKHPSPSPTRDQQCSGKSSSKSRPAGSLFPKNDSSPSSPPSRLPSTGTIHIANQPSRSSAAAATETLERRPQMRRQPLGGMDSSVSQNDIPSSLSQQQQQEYRQRQQQRLQQNRQREQELLQRQRLLEQQQQQQQKRKQLLLQLQQHQLQEQPQRRPQDTLPPLSMPSSSTLSRPKSSPVATTTIQSTPKKKKPLNPVQKAPSTENILASVRSTPTSVRSAMIATSPALSAAKNALLGNKRGHAAFEDKENLASTQSSPLRKEAYIAQKGTSSTRDQAHSPSKIYKRQKPASQVVDKSTLGITRPSIASPALVSMSYPISTTAAAISASSPPSVLSTQVHSTSEVTPVMLAESPSLAPSLQVDASEALRTSREFLKCFEQWMSDPSSGEIDNLSLDPLPQSAPQLSTPLSISNPESKESQVIARGCTEDYNQHGGDSEQEDETELDESEIDRLLYSEVGEDYGSYGDQGCVSTPGSELGHPELISDPGTTEVYDWFSDATQDLALYGSNDQHLSILSMDPTLSSSPAELTEALELGLEYDPAGEILWAQQEQQLQQLQLCQQQLTSGEIHELGSPRSETPQLDSTASTLLSSSSFSEILPNSITGNHSSQYIPMGLDGGLIISNAEDGNEDQDGVEQHIQKDPFLTRNDNNFEYIFGV